MDRNLKIQDIAFAALFGAIGMVALGAAVFFGKTHQFAMAAISAAMAGKIAKVIFHVQGLQASIVSRFGPGGEIVIDEDRAELYWGAN
jgi:hypothetical protein